ncbi:MAG TPA: EamA family transporter [Propionibacteriaceae bacterium]|nr:EamA family transporter [Propionibacteriaceae bacterium]
MSPVGVVAALLSALCYGVTPACARRSIRLLGFARANAWRLVVALVVMAALAFTLGRGVGDEAGTFALAGAVGFGVGGFAMFRALPLLGAPLSSLLVETTAAVAAGTLAWMWFGDAVSVTAATFSLVMLVGVVVGLLPYVRSGEKHPRLGLGVAFALLSALAQAFSGVLSRKALLAIQHSAAARGGGRVSSRFDVVFSASFDRLLGGLPVALALLALAVLLAGRAEWARAALTPAAQGAERGAEWTTPGPRLPDAPWLWVGANALFGPVLGVTSLVWALQYLQPGVAQAIAALAPLIAIPSARWLDGYRPPARFGVGVVVAVTGLAGLALS